MKVTKVTGYAPEYPQKKEKYALGLKLGAVAAAAVLAVGSIVGCKPDKPALGGAPMVTEPADVTPDPETLGWPEYMGEPAVDDTEVPEPPQTTGLLPVPDETEEPKLMGDVVISPEELP